jgi:AcrR family transcriptional regulator
VEVKMANDPSRDNSRVDRRIARTQRLLGEAMLDLIQEQSFDSITIRDITERADIGYATFFRHYDSKEELLSQQLESIIRQLEEMVGEGGDGYFEREGELLFEHVRQNELLYRGLLGGHVHVQVTRRLRDALIRVIRPHVERHLPDEQLLVPLEIAVNHLAASALELVAWWLENDMPYPPREMSRYYDRLIIQATWQAILPPGAAEHIQ